MNKPIQAKPQLYAYYFLQLKELALGFGYNLVVHGSLATDLDLIAIPWVDDPRPEIDLVKAMDKLLTGRSSDYPAKYHFSALPGGRQNYVIDLNRGGYTRDANGAIADPIEFTKDPKWYLDISFTPLYINNKNESIKH